MAGERLRKTIETLVRDNGEDRQTTIGAGRLKYSTLTLYVYWSERKARRLWDYLCARLRVSYRPAQRSERDELTGQVNQESKQPLTVDGGRIAVLRVTGADNCLAFLLTCYVPLTCTYSKEAKANNRVAMLCWAETHIDANLPGFRGPSATTQIHARKPIVGKVYVDAPGSHNITPERVRVNAGTRNGYIGESPPHNRFSAKMGKRDQVEYTASQRVKDNRRAISNATLMADETSRLEREHKERAAITPFKEQGAGEKPSIG